MNILIFSLAYFPYVGGAEVAIREITRRLPDLTFHLITQRRSVTDPAEEQVDNVIVHRVGRGSGYLGKMTFIVHAARRARILHTREAFTGIWAMMSYMVLPVVALRLWGVRIPYVLTLQDGDSFRHVFLRPHVLPFLPFVRYGFTHATAVSALSVYLASWPQRLGYDGEVRIIPNGAAVESVAHAVPRDVGKKTGDFWLVTSSRLVHKNAVDDVIRALPLLPVHVHFLVLGDGPDDASLKSLARRRGVRERVHFAGHIAHEDIPSYLRACDAFIRPSRTEGFGASFVEAMAAGLPVIATQAGGIADFLFDAERNPDRPATGFAVDPESPEQIAEAVRLVMTRPGQVQTACENARRLVVEKYDWNRVAGQMRTLFGTMAS
ncbi:hypothetical protein COU19_00575 [Candidatus Kaiserbacteria bacterium CG10_big_fil_rev_8_21_14_0_10_56_12]|uniref:Glycosyl transferase family 1 domain-containing protein n=1 Tax=Candidatus Kaiserbacteria bacterium CG10_big_fil_rev_8_21_14_0_10_56_12 TaxID=1974611 RepID=A0A2H0UAM0_9BACT|nr:MAG: hypothetical protein COU19_00575 [Candidatus Kaiserbacteria bacterium CG10_big_fil_rev_8_21_14_0_10_56_12]